jgi:hypothetical protein
MKHSTTSGHRKADKTTCIIEQYPVLLLSMTGPTGQRASNTVDYRDATAVFIESRDGGVGEARVIDLAQCLCNCVIEALAADRK